MADILLKVDETVLPDIAKAIMSKTGKTEPLKITQFASEITSITGGGNTAYYGKVKVKESFGHTAVCVGEFSCTYSVTV